MKLTILDDCKGTLEVHKATCADIAKKIRADKPFTHIAYKIDLDSKHAVWQEYNEDFIAEGSGTWDMTFLPCTGFVDKRENYNGGDECID